MTTKRFESVLDTTGGYWDVLPNDTSHPALDTLYKAGWQESDLRLPPELFIFGRVAESPDYYRSIAKAANDYSSDEDEIIRHWNTYKQVKMLYDAQVEQSLQH